MASAAARTRNALVALASVAAMLLLAYLYATQTNTGRGWLLGALLDRASGVFGGRGSLTVGVLRQIGPKRIVAEDVTLRDTAGVPVVHAEYLDGALSIGGLFSKAIHIRTLELRNVRMHFTQDFTGPFNIKYIISGDTSKGPSKGPGFGDDIRIDQLRISNAQLDLVSPWSPHPAFTGRARDSVIAVRDSLHDITKVPGGMLQRRVFTLDRVVAHSAVITDPDRGAASLVLDTLRGAVSDPPIRIAMAAGVLRWTGDSMQFRIPDLRLPASSGSAVGAVSWNTPGPLRYHASLDVRAGLSDLGWIWDVLPDSGRGTAHVEMRTLASADDAEYALRSLDVSAMSSHVTGGITVIVRPLVLELRDIALAFEPLGAALARRLSYGVLPETVHGEFRGHWTGSGGPLDSLRVDRLDARFADADVPGAISRVRFSGLLSLGAVAHASNARITDASIDLRTVQALAPTLPPVDGLLTGSVRIAYASLASADLRDAALSWTDGAGNTSAIRGDARAALTERDPALSFDLFLDPLSTRALARIDSTIPLRSTLVGHVTASGRLSALEWKASLSANASSGIALDGTAELNAPAWAVRGAGAITEFDVRAWFGGDSLPITALDGRVAIAASGTNSAADGISVRDATASVSLHQDPAPARPAFDLVASGTLDPRRIGIDSVLAKLGGITFDARGALARDSLHVDTLTVSARADSLNAARPELRRLAGMLQPLDSAFASSLRSVASDTLRGDFSLAGPFFGSIDKLDGTLALSVRDGQVGPLRVGRIFGSVRGTNVLQRPYFEAAATADDVNGIGAIRIATAEFQLQQASPDSGQLVLDVSAQDTSHLVIYGGYSRTADAFAVSMDTLRFQSGSATWRNEGRIRVVSDATGVQVDSLRITSSQRGSLALFAALPVTGPVRASIDVQQFPIGTASAFALGTPLFAGALTGDVQVQGTRDAPLIDWRLKADSLGQQGTYLPTITSDGTYADRRVTAHALLADSLGGALRLVARVPLDLSLASIDKRLLSDAVDAEINATGLRLGALGFTIPGVTQARGTLSGRLALTGRMDRPSATGTMRLDSLSAHLEYPNIGLCDGRLVVRAVQDSLIVEQFRVRSGGPLDTIGLSGAMRFAVDQPATMQAIMSASNFVLARQRDGTYVNVSGNLALVGPLRQPVLSGGIRVPVANLVIDPLNARDALDLRSAAAQELLGKNELPIAKTSSQAFASLGQYVTVDNARVDLGDEVWVRTPEANVRVTGGLDVRSTPAGLALEGEINANRGQYRLDLGLVNRSFSVDSGRVRFYGTPAIEPTVDISATNVVRLASGEEIPIRVHIGGTLDSPTLSLSSSSPLYASAPESEIISLLVFGAPTFALSEGDQGRVQALTGVLLPSAGGLVEGALQRLFPVFNTVQVNTAGRQTQDDLTALSILDNLSITAGLQVGDRTFLRLNTGVCRGSAQSAGRGTSLYYGVAGEYRIANGLLLQVGVDPGVAPCAQVGTNSLVRMQLGFDLFREWIF